MGFVVATRSNNEDEEHPYRVLAYPTGQGAPVYLPDALFCGLGGKRSHMFFKSMGAQDVSSYFWKRKVAEACLSCRRAAFLAPKNASAEQCQVVPRPRRIAVNPDFIPTREVAYGEICIESLFNERRSVCA